jgi:cell division protein FtsQ
MKTDLGMVYLGSNLSQFPQQLQVLNLMKQLPSRVPPHRVAYIDLTQPKAPSVQITMPSPKQSPASNVKKP